MFYDRRLYDLWDDIPDRRQRLAFAFASYNGEGAAAPCGPGPLSVPSARNGRNVQAYVPEETRNYVTKIMRLMAARPVAPLRWAYADMTVSRDRLEFLFLNVGHFLDHLLMLIFATVAAVRLAEEWGMSYAALIQYATPGFIAFGAGAIAAGWNRGQVEPRRQ